MEKQFSHEYYINLKNISMERAEEYKQSFRLQGEIVEVIETPVLTDEEIIQKNIETLEQVKATQEVEKSPEINYSIKEVKQMLKEKGVKNWKFLSDDQVIAKAKELKI